jgi:hypothetical protein
MAFKFGDVEEPRLQIPRDTVVRGYTVAEEHYVVDPVSLGYQTFGPNASLLTTATLYYQYTDFCAWGVDQGSTPSWNPADGLAVLLEPSAGNSVIWYVKSRGNGQFATMSTSAERGTLAAYDCGSSGWATVETNARDPESVWVAKPSTGEVRRVDFANGTIAPSSVLNYTLSPAGTMSLLYQPPTSGVAGYPFVVCGGILYYGTSAVTGLPAGVQCQQMTSDEAFLYVPDSNASQIHVVSVASKTYVRSIATAAAPNSVTTDGRYLWYTSAGSYQSLYCIDKAGNSVFFANGYGLFGAWYVANLTLAFDGRHIFVSMDQDSPSGTRRVDPESFEIDIVMQYRPGCKRLRAFNDSASRNLDLWGIQTGAPPGYAKGLIRIPTQPEVVRANHLRVAGSVSVQPYAHSGTVLEIDTQSHVDVDTSGFGTDVYLPRRPFEGMRVTIHDAYGSASAHNITVHSRLIYAPASPGNGVVSVLFGSQYVLTDAGFPSGDVRSTGTIDGDLAVITAVGAGALTAPATFRIGSTWSGATFVYIRRGTAAGSGITYKIYEGMQKIAAGVVSLSNTDVIATDFGYRTYAYSRHYGWQLMDSRG